tara:strand:- start:294 stop:416 length:123 start_codon:yes stop_codon:yes gene_type:complete
MSCHQNDILLEQLFEKYLDKGYNRKMAEELAIIEFENKSI